MKTSTELKPASIALKTKIAIAAVATVIVGTAMAAVVSHNMDNDDIEESYALTEPIEVEKNASKPMERVDASDTAEEEEETDPVEEEKIKSMDAYQRFLAGVATCN